MTRLRSGSATHVGRVRSVNQDIALETVDLFAVADGMGGHVGGEVAARVAVDALQQSFARHRSLQGLQRAVSAANAAVWEEARTHADLRGMGTTLAAMALVGIPGGNDVVGLANVGDSRAYLFSEGRLAQITADHSLAEEKVRHGELTEAEAAIHPHRHILTRALGVSATVDVDLWELHLRQGDRVLLCSDGLTNEVSPSEIAEVLAAIENPQDAAKVLVDEANSHGGNDNITVVVVDVTADNGPRQQGGTDAGAVLLSNWPDGDRMPGAPTGANGDDGADDDGADDGANGDDGVLVDPSMTGVVPATPRAEPEGAAEPGASTEDGPEGAAGAGSEDGAGPEAGPLPVPGEGGDEAGARAEDGAGEDGAGEAGAGAEASPAADTVAGSSAASLPVLDQQLAARPELAPAGRRESRRQRRRRLGIPRRLTLRVLLFGVLVAAVVYGGYLFVRWYANASWYATLSGNQVVIYQGRPGGVLWFEPKVVDRTGLTVSEIVPHQGHLAALGQDIEWSSLAQAKVFVHHLRTEYQQLHPPPPPTTVPTTSTTTTTSVPSATTYPRYQLLPTTTGTTTTLPIGPSGPIPTSTSTSATVPFAPRTPPAAQDQKRRH